MPDLLQQGAAWLANQLQAHAAQAVVYQRGTEQVALRATIGRKEFLVETTEGKLYVRASDFLIRRLDLVLAGQAVLPERGDRILVDFGAGTETFEVLPADGAPPWEFSDPFETLLRIHTHKAPS